MKDGINGTKVAPIAHTHQEIVPVHVIANIQISEIVHFVAVLQMINDHNVLPSPPVKRGDDIAADEAGTARDDNHIASVVGSLP